MIKIKINKFYYQIKYQKENIVENNMNKQSVKVNNCG